MQDKLREIILAELIRARNERLLYAAKLMAPEEPGLAGANQGWCLCTLVHPQMLDMLSSGAQSRLSVQIMRSPRQDAYLLVNHVIGSWCHRILIPLVGEQAARFVASIREGERLRLSVSTEESTYARMYQVSLLDGFLDRLGQQQIPVVDDVEYFLEDLTDVLAYFLQPSVLSDDSIEHVCVSYVIHQGIDIAQLLSHESASPSSLKH